MKIYSGIARIPCDSTAFLFNIVKCYSFIHVTNFYGKTKLQQTRNNTIIGYSSSLHAIVNGAVATKPPPPVVFCQGARQSIFVTKSPPTLFCVH